MAAILYRYAQYKGCDVSVGEDTNLLSYTDAAQVAEYAIPAFQWAVGAGIINGTTATTLSPKGSATPRSGRGPSCTATRVDRLRHRPGPDKKI